MRFDGRLHKTGAVHSGIVACTVDADYPALAARSDAAIRGASSLSGQLLRVNKTGP
jgi:hypothetical protein